jgi:hypothetical protein
VLVQWTGKAPASYDRLHIMTQPRANPWLEACGAHQRSPLRPVRAAASAVKFVRGYVSHLVAEHFFQERGLYCKQPPVETHNPAAWEAAAKGGAQPLAELNLDPVDDRGNVPLRSQRCHVMGQQPFVEICPIHSAVLYHVLSGILDKVQAAAQYS